MPEGFDGWHPYCKGAYTAHNGLRAANPYRRGSREHDDWMRGYDSGAMSREMKANLGGVWIYDAPRMPRQRIRLMED